MELKGKIALVTGGTKGIGYAIAQALSDKGAGVFICARNPDEIDEAIATLGSEAGGTVCDVRSESDARRAIGECVRIFGGIDVLVNNAGVGINGKTVEEMEPEDFRKTLETNLFGVYYMCHYGIPELKKRGGGYIINISSLAGQNPHPKMAAYNASKFGLNGFSEALMQEVRQDNIKVSYVCPGSVNTEFGGDTPSDEKSWQLQTEDIADVVMNLLSMDERALPSKVEIRPSKPPVKSL